MSLTLFYSFSFVQNYLVLEGEGPHFRSNTGSVRSDRKIWRQKNLRDENRGARESGVALRFPPQSKTRPELPDAWRSWGRHGLRRRRRRFRPGER
jgi:hypothetical protein